MKPPSGMRRTARSDPGVHRQAAAPAPTGSARLAAFLAVQAFLQRHAFVSDVLDEQFTQLKLSGLDRGLATEIACGVVRRQMTLDAILRAQITRSRASIEDGLWTLLQLGTYQLVFLTSVPPHAAVHETVQLARRIRHPRWSGFLNAVLRSVQRDLVPDDAGPARDSPVHPAATAAGALPLTAQLSAEAIPLGIDAEGAPQLRVLRLRQPVFPAPQRDLTGYLAAACSAPEWLVDRWRDRYGDDGALRLACWFHTPGQMFLRVNPLRANRAQVLELLAAAQVPAAPGRLPESVALEHSVRVENLPGFAAGWYSVQDESAMLATDLLDPQPGETILDLCAAPGGKTTHIAERMQNRGRIVACDVHSERLTLVTAACQRLGMTIVETTLRPVDIAADHPALSHFLPADTAAGQGPIFDAALVDVPCSNTGVLGKRPEARWRITPGGIAELVPLQMQLLGEAVRSVVPGGRVLYSTCSIEPEENQGVVRAVLSRHPELRLERELPHHPGAPADGGYQALLRHAAR